ncbi:hypothetical protein BJ508DRAFT_303087 [Ascobolus immersus RN42]|uniref:Uncharacterized protein n=1 Tax=Ascobolus immersus RN42 TaxID=1160509 RepID=A0A3N4IGT6_ASCIM|nr:hypothetical protein BJ508DRAFT_303087 [Ascobolus immersus RN42]
MDHFHRLHSGRVNKTSAFPPISNAHTTPNARKALAIRATKQQNARQRESKRVLNELRIEETLSHDERFKTSVRYYPRRDELQQNHAKARTSFISDHPYIQTFTRIDGKSSTILVVLDKKTNETAFVVKVHLFKDMTKEEREN